MENPFSKQLVVRVVTKCEMPKNEEKKKEKKEPAQDFGTYCIVKQQRSLLKFMGSPTIAFAAHIHSVDLDEDSYQNLAQLNKSAWVFKEGFYAIWATVRDNLSSGLANSKGADQPAHLRILISAFYFSLIAKYHI